jgi:hypothetical protein
VYLKHRHKAATANRLLRFVCLLVMCFGNTPSNQAALASSLRLTPEGTGKPEAMVALLNMCRPLFLTGLIVQGGVSATAGGACWQPPCTCAPATPDCSCSPGRLGLTRPVSFLTSFVLPQSCCLCCLTG